LHRPAICEKGILQGIGFLRAALGYRILGNFPGLAPFWFDAGFAIQNQETKARQNRFSELHFLSTVALIIKVVARNRTLAGFENTCNLFFSDLERSVNLFEWICEVNPPREYRFPYSGFIPFLIVGVSRTSLQRNIPPPSARMPDHRSVGPNFHDSSSAKPAKTRVFTAGRPTRI
jgi:hypothetical protein